MNYEECLAFLNRLGNEVLTMKFGLETIRRLLGALDSPEKSFQSVLVAGTNGKGSVARYLDAMARKAQIRTGLFTSPHLVNLTERIRIAGDEIEREQFADSFTEVVAAVQRLERKPHPTFFELVTATGLLCFARAGVDLAVLEIGMGGRLDSTNAVDPVLSLITAIDYDHQQYLGNTLTQIAREKAGIMRRGKPVVSSLQLPEATAALIEAARETGANLHFADPSDLVQTPDQKGRWKFTFDSTEFQLGACGRAQVGNALLAIHAARNLGHRGFEIGTDSIQAALQGTEFKGVLWRVSENPTVLVDGGHNPGAARILADYVGTFTARPRTLVFGMMKDKDLGAVTRILDPLFDQVLLTRIDSPRAAEPTRLLEAWPRGVIFESSDEAYRAALGGSSTVVVAGSFFLAGEITRLLT
jgi:dihydrofolate synthase/folylpolyglutamate synthase